MPEEIETHYRKSGFSDVDDLVLATTATTRIVLRPGIHADGIRGAIIRQKVGSDGAFRDINEVDFRRLPADCGVAIELDTEATTRLFHKLEALYEIQRRGAPRSDRRLVVAAQDEVLLVDDEHKRRAIEELLDHGYSTDVWEALVQKDPDLASQLAAGQIELARQQVIREFAESLESERDNEDYWQVFFETHPWILMNAFSAPVVMLRGEAYVGGKAPVGRQGLGGVATDFLFADESTNSFAVVEIKTPGTRLVGGLYRGDRHSGHDNETYSMSAELSGAIVQVRNQISVAIEHFQGVLGPEFRTEMLNRVHPKCVLVIGRGDELDARERASFNQFRHGQYSLTAITFDELLKRLCILYGVAADD